ncbi:hypothetical protein KEM48_008698 [Puccinia striiformis f. sp. tritici PST-130]|nr:hypothetical protein KEM48_008698 [Puccinia striiformis f. sp. tritici PST-130]
MPSTTSQSVNESLDTWGGSHVSDGSVWWKRFLRMLSRSCTQGTGYIVSQWASSMYLIGFSKGLGRQCVLRIRQRIPAGLDPDGIGNHWPTRQHAATRLTATLEQGNSSSRVFHHEQPNETARLELGGKKITSSLKGSSFFIEAKIILNLVLPSELTQHSDNSLMHS